MPNDKSKQKRAEVYGGLRSISKVNKTAGATLTIVFFISSAAYSVYKKKQDKCLKLPKEQYKDCRINAINSAISQLDSMKTKCEQSKKPKTCYKKIEQKKKHWLKRRKQLEESSTISESNLVLLEIEINR